MSEIERAEAEQLYQKAKRLNWRNDAGDAALAYAYLENAAGKGHTRAKFDWALMMSFGAGGPKDPARAMGLMLSVFAPEGLEPLDSLVEQLQACAADGLVPDEQDRAERAAEKAEQAVELLRYVFAYVSRIAGQRMAELHRQTAAGSSLDNK
jgi:hypothetical protein